MPKTLKLTQKATLALIRKKLPPARKVILDAKTKARRKRVKAVLAPKGFWHSDYGQWFTNSH